jgi:hypothetical protein
MIIVFVYSTDKNQCSKFKQELDNSFFKLDELIRRLTNVHAQRQQLLEQMQCAEIFYDAQFKEAKTVYNVVAMLEQNHNIMQIFYFILFHFSYRLIEYSEAKCITLKRS